MHLPATINAHALPILPRVPPASHHISPALAQILPVIQGLKMFFLGCFERGDLPASLLAATDPAAQGAEAVFASWLQRQYAACCTALLDVLSSGTDARTQLSALAALMEFVRGERAGAFANVLFSKLLSTALLREGVAPQVIGALLEKYGQYDDVRYHTMRTLCKICERNAARAAGAAASAAGASDDDSNSDSEAEAEAALSQGTKAGDHKRVSPHDLARNVFDVLIGLPVPAAAAAAGEDDPEGGLQLQSWCGAAEFGIVQAAADAEGSRQRKKRRLQQKAQQGAPSPSQPPPQPHHKAKWASPKLQRRAYSAAWLSLLSLPLPDDIYRKVLAKLHDGIIPHLFNPLLLSDFLSLSLDKGGLIGMLALNGIFVLVTRHGLEYPRFYERMYELLTLDAFRAKHRLRFFQLADIFLASGLVPAYTAAAFAKRFARLALATSPAGAMVCLAFIHNIVRRHPACVQLLHRPPAGGITALAAGQAQGPSRGEVDQGGAAGGVWEGEDPYDASQPDPAKSRALESSLWEVSALRQHADPSVAAFCAILDRDLTNRRKTAEVDVGEVLQASYTSMFDKEAGRRLKQVPTAFHATPPTSLFEGVGAGGGAGEGSHGFPGWELAP